MFKMIMMTFELMWQNRHCS